MSREIDAYRRTSQQGMRERLIYDHLALVRHVAGRLLVELPPGVDAENLESAGTLGLVEAAAAFDPARGVQFSTFAYQRVRGAMLDELRRNSPLPQALLEKAARVRQALAQLPRPASLDQLAAATQLSTDEVSDCLGALRLSRTLSLGDRTASREESPLESLERADQARVLTEAVEQLPRQERLVVTLYYREGLRLKEIGAVMQLSESRVSRLLSAALFALRESMQSGES
jgi:RNA polymerase sigma factor for flagellar operon FliA